MKNRTTWHFVLLAFGLLACNANSSYCQEALPGNAAQSKLNMVASVHPVATQAGINALEKGGNAVDAAVATALTLGVVDGFNSGIGGGCFIVLRTAEGKLVALDGREMAPGRAERDMYLRNGKADSSLSQNGPLAIGVPGALAAYEQIVREHGKLPFKDLIAAAAKVAEDGFVVTKAYEKKLKGAHQQLKKFGPSLLKPDGSFHSKGETIKLPELANTYRKIADQGTGWFYRGEFSQVTEKWMGANGGILTQEDFKNYKTVTREPVRTRYRGLEIVGFPPPSSGGVHVAQILNILENFDLKKLYAENPVAMKHVVAEAMKLAFADRAYWLGDPDYVKVPKGLIDTGYAKALSGRIDLAKVTPVKSHGTPPKADSEFFAKHTTHVAAADKAGNWVAITTTVNTGFGSKVIVPGLGVVMNNQMDDFSIAPGTPNAFGLIGGENNSIAPGKRPLSSMSPTIVLKDGKPIMTVGAAGGPKIITEVVWAIINHVDLGMPVHKAIAAPRIHHQWSPDKLRVENGKFAVKEEWARGLESKGHKLNRSDVVGITQAIGFDPATGVFIGASDPRTTGKAKGSKK